MKYGDRRVGCLEWAWQVAGRKPSRAGSIRTTKRQYSEIASHKACNRLSEELDWALERIELLQSELVAVRQLLEQLQEEHIHSHNIYIPNISAFRGQKREPNWKRSRTILMALLYAIGIVTAIVILALSR